MIKLIQSYVLEKYFVSTAYRKSSITLETPVWYYETIVWEWNRKTKIHGKIIEMQDSGSLPSTALENHYEICKKLIKKV